MPRRSQRDRADQFIGKLPDNFLNCRRLGHAWKHDSAEKYGRSFVQVLRCRECGTQRVETIDSRGELLSSRPIYPDGYLAKGLGFSVRGSKGTLRLEMLDRVGVVSR